MLALVDNTPCHMTSGVNALAPALAIIMGTQVLKNPHALSTRLSID